jgi:D-amino peptidase
MKVFISADMEGTTGATCWNDVDPSKRSYQRFRRLLTGDVNAAIEGALEAGATEVLVNEAHDGMRNILIEELNTKARLISGFMGKRLCMMSGIDGSFDAAFLISYHSRAGTDAAIMNHTLLLNIHNFWINGVLVGEGGISSAMAGHHGVPVALVSGDDKVAKEMKELLGDVETAETKVGVDRYTADCLTPEETGARIKQAAKRALERVGDFKPYKVEAPVKLEVEFTSASTALLASTVPGIVKEGPRRISHTAEDMIQAWSTIWPSILVSMPAENSPFARGIE